MTDPVRPIRTASDRQKALAEIDELFDAEEGSPEADRREVLAILVASYEREQLDSPMGEFKMRAIEMGAKIDAPWQAVQLALEETMLEISILRREATNRATALDRRLDDINKSIRSSGSDLAAEVKRGNSNTWELLKNRAKDIGWGLIIIGALLFMHMAWK